jgi:two-component system, OmpR family, response regulator MprA
MHHILVVEDEAQIAHVLQRGLIYKGFEVVVAASGKAAIENIQHSLQDLVVLDVMLPDMDGFEVCRLLRLMDYKSLPILMLTAKDGMKDKIAGLDSGADDYITKPFDFEELLARIRAGLRRAIAKTRPIRRIKVEDVTLDLETRQVWRDGHLLAFTKREFDLFELLAQNAGRVLTKERIFERIWGYDNEAGLEVIKVYMNYVRTKLNAGGKPDLIQAVRGVGYTLKREPHPFLTRDE